MGREPKDSTRGSGRGAKPGPRFRQAPARSAPPRAMPQVVRSALLVHLLVGLDLLAGALAREAQRSHRPGHQALEADRLRALLALVDDTFAEPAQRLADLAGQPGLAIREPQLGGVQLLLGRL